MKFISFIASTMLIVLINQHSIMGLPLNDTVVKESCSEGLKWVNGKCMPMEFMTTTMEIETSSNLPEHMIIHEEKPVTELYTPKKFGACPEGMKHGEHGICEEIKHFDTTEVTVELTTELNEKKGGVEHIKDCPEGMKHDEHGICEEMKHFDTTEVTVKLTTELNEKKSGVENIKDCLKGMKHGEHGICEEIKHFDTMEVPVKLTTELNEKEGGVENVKGCPDGTEPDEEGACQESKPSKPTKMINDPKTFLNKDGSCPDNYKMIEGQCLYIKPKTNSTLYPSGSSSDDNLSTGIRPKVGIDESSKFELVPVLSDNSCPEGTEYSEYGLCQKRLRVSSSNLRMKPDGSCPDDFELINGKCTEQKVKVPSQSGFLTTTISMPVDSTPNKEDLSNDEIPKPIKVYKTTSL